MCGGWLGGQIVGMQVVGGEADAAAALMMMKLMFVVVAALSLAASG